MSAKIVPLPTKPKPKPKAKPEPLTVRRIEALQPKAKKYVVFDAARAGLVVEVTPGGSKSFYVQTRIGRGRDAQRKNIRVGSFPSTSLADARAAADRILGETRRGIDPTRVVAGQGTLEALIDAYQADLVRRQAVRTKDVVSSLRRGLKHLLRIPAGDLTRADIVDAIARVPTAGAAGYLRKNVTPMLNYGVTAGLIAHNVMAGYRVPRQTRAEKLARADRKLTLVGGGEICLFWSAVEGVEPLYRDFLRICLLTGQRRNETASIRWTDIDGGIWTVPAGLHKMGETLQVPLGEFAQKIINAQPKRAGSPYVFSTRTGGTISNHSRRSIPVKRLMQDAVLSASDIYPDDAQRTKRSQQMGSIGPHALRRSYRTGLSDIGISEPIAELMIGHARSDLVGRYDKSELLDQRRDVQRQWESHVSDVVF